MKHALSVFAFLISVWVAATAQSTNPGGPPVVASSRLLVHFEVENQLAKVDSPVFVQLLLKNVSTQPLRLLNPWTEQNIKVSVVDQAGNAVPLTKEGERTFHPEAILRNEEILLNPGKTEWAAIEITRLFQLRQPGKYSLQASRSVKAETPEQARAADERGFSNVVTFTVVPAGSPLLRTGPENGIRSKSAMFPGDVSAPFQISFDSPSVFITAGEPVIADLVLRNTSSSQVKIDVTEHAEPAFRVSVVQPDGERTDIFVPHGGVSAGWFRNQDIGAAQSYVRRTILSKWFPFDEPGEYSVAIFVPEAAAPAVLHVSVGPRDEARLEAICADLEKRADKDEDLLALSALSVIRDPIAVRHLRRYAGNDLGLQALAAIGNADAISILAEVARGGNAKLSQRAINSLKGIRSSTADLAIKAVIDGALAQPK